jgi:hypothetical protein
LSVDFMVCLVMTFYNYFLTKIKFKNRLFA